MTKDTTKAAAVAAETLLFDDWFDPIEDGVRERVRGFIETMLEEELDGAVAPALWPAQAGRGRGGAAGRRLPARPSRADADGHVRQDADRRAARPDDRRGRQDERVEEQIAAGLPAAHPGRRRADRRGLSCRDQHAPGAPGACGGVRRAGRQGRGQPRLAQGEGRLGGLERALLADEPIVRLILDGTVVRVRLDSKATSISLLVALGVRARRPEGAAGGQEHGRRERGRLAGAPRRSRPARLAERRSSSSSTARRASRRRWPRCGPTCRSSAARCTSIAICSPMRRSGCTRKSRPTTTT